MTFTEIQTEVLDRLGLSSTDDTARIGRAINRVYRTVTSALGIKHVSRRTIVNATTSIGISALAFTSSEKVVAVFNRNVSPYKQLEEVTVDELEAQMPFAASDTPTKYAIQAIAADTVTVLLNCVPQTAFALYADVYGTTATLSGSDEPAFSESYHDILIHGVLVDEYLKTEKPSLSALSEKRYDKRMGELQLWIAVSTTKQIHQGKTTQLTPGAGSGGSGSSVNGALSYEQTGLITFNRGTGAPFAVSNASAAVVTNLDADELDGQHGAYYRDASNLNAGTVPDARFPAVLPAVSGANLTNLPAPANINAATITSGTLPDGRFPATLPAASGVNLTALNASNLGSGTVPDARFPATLPAVSGANLTNLDAADLATGLVPVARIVTEQTTTATGAQNNFDLNGHFTVLRCTGAAPSFSGFTVLGATPVAGDQVVIMCLGTTAKVTNQDTNSTAANRTITESSTGQIVGVNGTIVLVYDGTTARWRIARVSPGASIDVAFASGNFTASSGNWTLTSPDQVVFRYQQVGKLVFFEFSFNNTTVSATPTALRVEIGTTTGFTVSGRFIHPCRLDDNGTVSIGNIDFNSAVTYVQFSELSGTWQTATDATGISWSGWVTVG